MEPRLRSTLFIRILALGIVGVASAAGGAAVYVALRTSRHFGLDPARATAFHRSLLRGAVLPGAFVGVIGLLVALLVLRSVGRRFGRHAAVASAIRAGNIDVPFETRSHDESGSLGRALEDMRLELRGRLTSASDRSLELREIAARALVSGDEERARAARQLDDVEGALTMLRMSVGVARERTRSQAHASTLDGLSVEIDKVLLSVRNAAASVFPQELVSKGLTAALQGYAPTVPVESAVECEPDPLPRLALYIETNAYFLVTEAVTLALESAHPASIAISLRVADGWLHVGVTDDGDRTGAGPNGVDRMRDRARLLGGDFALVSVPRRGTSVTATFPALGPDQPQKQPPVQRPSIEV